MSDSPLQRAAPAFVQIAEHYAAQIREGKIRPGDWLPTAAEIQSTWGVSRGTVGKATDRLKTLGLVESHPPRGLRVVGQAEVTESLTPARRGRPAPKPARRTP